MARLKCKKCGNVYEQGLSAAILAPHVGPYHYVKCPVCEKRSWLNVFSSVKDPTTWPKQETEPVIESQLSAEELEKKRIEDSKYERA